MLSTVVIGPDVSAGAELSFHFNSGFGSIKTARVVKFEDHGARAVIEVEGESWWLHRRVVASVGGAAGTAFRC